MEWDAIGAIAELLGAIGVIASLVYLATQIRQSREQMRQNTQALKSGAYQQFQDQIVQTVLPAAHDANFARVIRRSLSNVDDLDEDDAYRFFVHVFAYLTASENAHYQFRMGQFDEERWRLYRSRLETFIRTPGVGKLWSRGTLPDISSSFTMAENMSPEFVALVEEILGEEPDRGE